MNILLRLPEKKVEDCLQDQKILLLNKNIEQQNVKLEHIERHINELQMVS